MVRQMIEVFGIGPVSFVLVLEFFVRGVLYVGLLSALLPFYRDVLGVADAATYQAYGSVATLAWVTSKPLTGLLSDSFPVGRYHKRWYLVASSLICCVALSVAAFLPPPTSDADRRAVTLAFTFTAFVALSCVATMDVLVEGTYSAMIRQHPREGSMLLTLAYGFATAGNVTASLVAGPLADAGHTRLVFFILIPVALLCGLPAALNWSNEQPVSPHHSDHHALGDGNSAPAADDEEMTTGGEPLPQTVARDDVILDSSTEDHPHNNEFISTGRVPSGSTDCGDCLGHRLGGALRHHPDMAAMACVVGVAGGVMGVSVMLLQAKAALAVTVAILGLITFLAFRWLEPIIARSIMAIVLMNCTYITIPGAMDYFFLADEACLPGGPHFDYTYYQTTTNIISAFASGVGLWFFQRYLAHGTYGRVLVVTTLAQAIASMFDVVIVTRANKRYLHLSDKATYFWGDAIMSPATAMMNFMPTVILLSRLCPKGVEAVMYALLAGMSNFGMTVARIIGQQMIVAFGVRTEAPCDFTNLAPLIVVTHLIVPALFLPAVFRMLPQRRMDEPIDAATEATIDAASDARSA